MSEPHSHTHTHTHTHTHFFLFFSNSRAGHCVSGDDSVSISQKDCVCHENFDSKWFCFSYFNFDAFIQGMFHIWAATCSVGKKKRKKKKTFSILDRCLMVKSSLRFDVTRHNRCFVYKMICMLVLLLIGSTREGLAGASAPLRKTKAPP